MPRAEMPPALKRLRGSGAEVPPSPLPTSPRSLNRQAKLHRMLKQLHSTQEFPNGVAIPEPEPSSKAEGKKAMPPPPPPLQGGAGKKRVRDDGGGSSSGGVTSSSPSGRVYARGIPSNFAIG